LELIDGGEGVNQLVGGSSRTVWDFSATELRDIASIRGGAGHDTITGSNGNDTIVGGAGNDYLLGGDGDDTFIVAGDGDGFDTLIGGKGSDTLLGSVGDDTIGLANLRTSASVELIDGGEGVNELVGGSSRTVWDFSDTELRNIASINGGSGHDTITGSSGNDTIVGGAGNDLLEGGAGNDTYMFGSGDGRDTLLVEQTGIEQDLLLLQDVNADRLWFTQSRNDLLVDFLDTDDSVTVRNWFGSEQNQLGHIATETDILYASQVQLLVDAMASFEPQAFGGVTGVEVRAEPQLQAALTAAWQPSAA
jgi:Ca2+-binding RTX toxin-like protein